jgi:hypothetical protein
MLTPLIIHHEIHPYLPHRSASSPSTESHSGVIMSARMSPSGNIEIHNRDRLQYRLLKGILRRQTMKLRHGILTAILSGLLIAGLSACEKDGPAEKAGEAIDETAADVAEHAEEAKEAVEEKMKAE